MLLSPYWNQIAFAWSLTLLNTTVLGSVILLGTLLLNQFAKRSSTEFRFSLILFALMSFLLLPVLTNIMPVTATNSAPVGVGGQKYLNREAPFPKNLSPQIYLRNNDSKESLGPFCAGFLLIWLIGATIVGLRICCGIFGMYRLLRMADRQESTPEDWFPDLPNRIAILPELHMPVTCGLFSPWVLLPAKSRDWSMEQRQAILRHEAAHIRRRDNLTNLLAQIIVALYWFNPLVWLAWGQLRINREKACDDWVLRSEIKPSTYAGILLDAIRANNRSHFQNQNQVALYFNTKGEERLRHVLNSAVNHQILSTKAKVLMLLLTVILLIPLSTFQLLAADDNPPIANNSDQKILPQISLNGNIVAVKLIFADKRTQLFTCFATEVPIGWPEKGVRNNFSSGFGYRIHPILKKRTLHSGIDIRSKLGTQIVAAADGKVIKAEFRAGYGNTVIIKHSHFTTLYAQLSEIKAKVGADIKQGELIGYSGKSGMATGPHLHYEIHYQTRPIDPQPFLDAGLK
jgi:murein DD-endopeptidase MepM/ murein hydrolase activator NlpD